MSSTNVIPTTQPNAIPQAVKILKNGGTVVFPTDTVYGLAACAFYADAIDKLFAIKERQPDQAIAVLLGDIDQLNQVTKNASSAALKLAKIYWPGALTLILPQHPAMPENLSPLATLGVRIPDHPVALELLRASGPLAVTSANLSGRENSTTAQEAFSQLGQRVDLVLDGGKTPGGVPSTVVDLTGEKLVILREGPVKLDPSIL